jgi:cell division transport system permease protein
VTVLRFLVAEALRDLRQAGRVAVSAVLLIMLSLTAVGGFWVLSSNLGRAVGQWRDRVRIIVYLKQESAAPDALVERVRALPGVAAVRYVGKAEALAILKGALGREAAVADRLPSNPLPASLEVTPDAGAATPEGARALVARLAALPEAEEIGGGMDWIHRLSKLRRLLDTVGLGIGAALAGAAVLTVTTATTLVLHARRDETEIMRLVGAPELTVRLPLVLQGVMQGLLGAVLAMVVLGIGYRVLGPRLEPDIALTLGLPRLAFLTPAGVGVLVLGGTVLGGIGGVLARGRREPGR